MTIRRRLILLLGCVALVALGTFAWSIGGHRPLSPEAAWLRIQGAMARRDWSEADSLLRGILKQTPRNGQALAALGSLLASQDRRSEAEATLNQILSEDPAWPKAQGVLGELAVDDHRAADAEAAFRRAIERDGTLLNARQGLVFLTSLEGRTGEARDQLWEMYNLTHDPRALLDLVLSTWAAENDTRGLIDQLEPFINKSPDDARLRRIWGLALLQVGRPREARPHLESAASRFSNDPGGRFALAECLMALGEAPPGPEFLGAAPDDPMIRSLWNTLRARLAETRSQTDVARECLTNAVQENPRNREAHFRLGQLLTRLGKAAEGKRHLDEAEEIRRVEGLARREHARVRAAGFDREAFERLAKLCLDAGLIAEARAWLEQAVRTDPTRRSAQSALAALSNKQDRFPYPFVRLKPIDKTETISPALPLAREVASAQGVHFEDRAKALGLNFTYDSGAKGDLFIGDTMGGGVALIDYDRDGRLDVYFINGCKLPYDTKSPPAPNRLFRNRPDGQFEDVTEKARVGGRGYGMGAAVADFDGDGFDDLFVTGLGSTVLYRNRGDGTFEDVTKKAGVVSDRWTTAAGFGDLDGDGDLDLVAVAYVEADPTKVTPCLDHAGKPIHCSPGQYPAQLDHLWRNNGDGTFTDVAMEAGFPLPNGRGLGLAIADLDEDGKLDLFIANDASPNFYFRNLGGLKFEEMGISAGLALDGKGKATASMGVVADDLDGDGLIDLLHTNFINESCTFRRNLGRGMFEDATLMANLDSASRSRTGFGAAALDADGDGRLDLFLSNGHVDDQPWIDTPMAQEAQLFLSVGPGRFRPADNERFPYLARKVVGRGVAMGDLNGDGAVDLVVVHRDAPAALLINQEKPRHWLGIKLMGKSAVGARVTCRSSGKAQTRFLSAGTSYLSVHDPRLWFSLGANPVDEVEVRWMSGRVSKLSAVAGDRVLEVREP